MPTIFPSQASSEDASQDADIADNAADIATNAANIATNAANIATNEGDISTLDTTVSSHGTSISTNATDIATLESRTGHQTETETFFTAAGVPDSIASAMALDLFIGKLVDRGIWAKCDAIYMLAQDAAARSLKDLKQAFSAAAISGAPTTGFHRGYTQDGGENTVRLFASETMDELTQFTQDDCHAAYFMTGATSGVTHYYMGTTGGTNKNFEVGRSNTGILRVQLTATAIADVTGADTPANPIDGFFGFSRVDSSNVQAWTCKLNDVNVSSTSTAVEAASLYTGKRATAEYAQTTYFVSVGAALSDAEMQYLRGAVTSYLLTVGAIEPHVDWLLE